MKRIYLNNDWSCTWKGETTKVRIPHSVVSTEYNYFDENVYQGIAVYRRELAILPEWKNQVLLLTLEGSAHYTKIFVNGELLAEHCCGYTGVQVEIQKAIHFSPNEKNILEIHVDSNETLNQPPFGNVVDYMTYGGIYRDVYLEIKAPKYLKDIYFAGVKKNGEYQLVTQVDVVNRCA